jgi:hypothetical protein
MWKIWHNDVEQSQVTLVWLIRSMGLGESMRSDEARFRNVHTIIARTFESSAESLRGCPTESEDAIPMQNIRRRAKRREIGGRAREVVAKKLHSNSS